jgi:hypothetical protein
MRFVSLPSGTGWHFVNVEEIIAVKHTGPRKTSVLLTGGIALECSEDTHVIHKRIDDYIKFVG